MKDNLTIAASKILAIVSILFLTGCSAFQPKEVVVEKKTVIYKNIPDHLLQSCQTSRPPNTKTYLTASEKERSELMTNYTNDLIADVKKCNDRITLIKEWDQKQNRIYGSVK